MVYNTLHNTYICFAWSVVVVTLGLCMYAPRALAAQYSVSPKIIDVSIQPRDINEQKILITNHTESTLTLYPFVNNVSVGVAGGVQAFLPPSMSDRTNSLASWLEVQRTGVEVGAGETREIPLTIRVNPTAVPGVYHTLISYATGGNGTEAEATVARGDAPSIMINATIEDKRSEFLSLSRFFINRFVTGKHESDVQYQVANTGDLDIVPRGDIVLYNQRGEEVGAIAINATKQMIKPGESMSFSAEVPTDHLFGKYKAFMRMQYGEGQASVYDTVYFYVLPWKTLSIFFGAFLIIAIMLSLLIHYKYFRASAVLEDAVDHVFMEVRDSPSPHTDHDIVMKR